MSEYQYYEFRTIDRQLTAIERDAVNGLSSHGHTTATSFSVVYNWGDFKHDEDDVLAEYFDAFIYITNWGSLSLKFRYPKELINTRAWEPYCIEHEMMIDYKEVGDSIILSFIFNTDSGGDWIEGEGLLDNLIGLYQDILDGDYRLLYLAWLRAIQDGTEGADEFDEETLEPPVPSNLNQLSPELKAFVTLFEVNQNLIDIAGIRSKAQTWTKRDEVKALKKLAPIEAIDFLHRFLQREPHLAQKLKQRVGLLQPAMTDGPTGQRTIGNLLNEQG